MELNAKLSSLEDEVKLLKGEVKVILSEIRAAVLGQDNPFTTEPGQGLHVDRSALEERPPIRIVKIPAEGQEEEPSIEFAETQSEASFLGDAASPAEPEEVLAIPEPTAAQLPPREQELPAAMPAARAEPPPSPPPPTVAAAHPPAIPPQTTHEWSLLTIAGLAVWAEDAVKQIGSERLRVLLDLCEFTGYLSTAAKEALLSVTSLAPAAEEKDTTPSVNDCLVVLYQLDALMRGEEPAAARRLSGLAH
jgi:hypothetical protein